jgi:aspartate/glutamate racemase
MKPVRVALIHATALAVTPIQEAFARHWPQANCMNLLDDSLSRDRAQAGELTPAMVQRFVDLAQYVQRAGCQGILFTCSAFGPAIEAAGRATGLPTLKPNEAMFEQALALPAPTGVLRLGLVATFEASIPSMSEEFEALAAQRGVKVVLHSVFVPQAMADLAAGQADLHHERIAKALSELPECDGIMLAQFSMAAAQPVCQQHASVPVLSSPDCAVTALQQAMHHV